jgi:hypothetical protein
MRWGMMHQDQPLGLDSLQPTQVLEPEPPANVTVMPTT